MQQAKATVSTVRIAPRKVRMVVDLIRGKKIGEAVAILQLTPKAASPVVEKVLKSAIANAEHNYEMGIEDLIVSEIFVDEGPTMKRFRPRAQGRASAINKRTSHITVVVSEKRRDNSWVKKYILTVYGSVFIRDWESKWYAEKDYATLLHEDLKIREYIDKRLVEASVSKVEIERAAKRVNITIHTAKPGMVIGKGGTEVETLRKQLNEISGKRVHINIIEIKRADLDAKLVAESIARQLEGRVSFRRVQKQAIQRTIRSGALGIKTQVSGRLGGADIARAEHYSEGTVPLHTLRADIDYAHAEADTTFGKLGVKVWIYRGEVLPVRKKNSEEGGN